MILKDAKHYLPFVQAASEGKTIQLHSLIDGWQDCSNCDFSERPERYRIKPEQKLRPWTGAEGVGKIVNFKDGSIGILASFDTQGIFITSTGYYSPEYVLENTKQLDGSPCGVME